MYLTYVGSQNDVVPLRTEKLAAHKDLKILFRGLIKGSLEASFRSCVA